MRARFSRCSEKQQFTRFERRVLARLTRIYTVAGKGPCWRSWTTGCLPRAYTESGTAKERGKVRRYIGELYRSSLGNRLAAPRARAAPDSPLGFLRGVGASAPMPFYSRNGDPAGRSLRFTGSYWTGSQHALVRA